MNKPAGLLQRALDAWYGRAAPLNPRRRSDECADYYGVSRELLWKYTQLDFGRRVDSY